MACAELVDSQLRSGIRAARSNRHRCFKAVVVGGTATAPSTAPALGDKESGNAGQRTLALATAMSEEPGATLAAEFNRCVTTLVDDSKPCLLLFRTDIRENVDGSRWLLIAWLPDGAQEGERATCVRSRGLLARLVPQPYFLREFFAKQRGDLVWDVARAGSEPSQVALPEDVVDAVDACQRGARPSLAMTRLAPQGPLKDGQNVAAALQRLGRREEIAIRFSLARQSPIPTGPMADALALANRKKQQQVPVLDCQILDVRSPAQLAQGLPSSPSFFAMLLRDHLLFIFWCPDTSGTKDTHRTMEDARYAVAKASVLRMVVEAIPAPKPYVAQVEARESTDVATGADQAAKRVASRMVDFQTPVSEKDCDSPRQPTPAAAVPSTMTIDARPFPPWRGGSKTHTITGAGLTRGASHALGLPVASPSRRPSSRTGASA